ncbi:hypothetical protein HJC23_009672 [Cyclotella cryptica]|uniref:Uncharacterized protein n=1 Tax=Cyclotella cryptica TaxID=29204 RepID=A0ABD3Q9A8_9STRA
MTPDASSTDAQSQGLALLEEWPRRKSLSEYDDIDVTPNPMKRVTFSTYSSARFFKCSASYRANMSHSSADCKLFRAEVAREGLRIQRLMSSSCSSMKTGNVIHHLVGLNVLSMEELVGIEHLVSKGAPIRLVHERRSHAAIVLKAQSEMKQRNDITFDDLARVAVASSSRSVQKARLRAALASQL